MNFFFKPKTIALIGASQNPEKLGCHILKNIVSGFPGRIFPVNPKSPEILGLKCYPDILQVPSEIELALIVIPPEAVLKVVEDCGKKGVRGIIIVTAGFKESGPEGAARETELTRLIRKYGIRMIGPNCLGVMDTATPLNASFALSMPLRGNIAFFSQSGAIGSAILDWSIKENVGFSKFVSLGNKADISEIELMEYCAADPDTKVILLYLESISDGRRFIDVARKVTRIKPVIAVKSGATTSGSRAASSHTGSLAGSDSAYQTAFLQSGIFRTRTLEELFDLALLFAYQPVIPGDRIAVVTNAGGPGVMTMDAIEKEGLTVSALSEDTKSYLRGILSASANVNNPVDILGDAGPETYRLALEKVLQDKNVDGVVTILTPQTATRIEESSQAVADAARTSSKTLVSCFMGGEKLTPAFKILTQNSIPNYFSPERAVASLRAMAGYRRYLQTPEEPGERFLVDKETVDKLFARARLENRFQLGDQEGREIVKAYGIRTPASCLASQAEEAKKFAGTIGYPVVMKIVSPDIIHKTEVDGVKTGIRSDSEVEKTFEYLIRRAREARPGARITGVCVQEMIPDGQQVIVGVSRSSQFGHLLMFGLGGIYVEILKDVSFRIVPVTRHDAETMLSEIRGSAILKGVRGQKPADTEGIIDTILRISQLCTDFPEIEEMDINPLFSLPEGQGVVAVDVRLALASGKT